MNKAIVAAALAASAIASPAFAQTLTTDLGTWQAVAGAYLNDSQYGTGYDSVSSVTLDGGPKLSFGSNVTILDVPGGWNNWPGGYTGQVLWSTGLSSVTVNVSPKTSDFGFFAEANSYSTFLIQLSLTGGGSVQQLVTTPNGAKFFGWNGGGVSSFTVSAVGDDFAFGNFYYTGASGVPEPAAWGLMIFGFGLAGAALRRRTTVKVSYAA